jgi:large subunit ribosomal protein L4
MSTLEIKNSSGKAAGKYELGVIAKSEPLMHLLHQAVVTEEANSRQGTQKTKSRSETWGGGRKPYKQKKTGNARQGSTRSPQYAHGAMALALMPRDYTKQFNRKERRAAILGALNAQFAAGNVIVVDAVNFNAARTKDAEALLKALGVNDVRRVLVITNGYDENTYKCFRNLKNVVVRTAPTNAEGVKSVAFSTRDILVAHKIVFAKDALEATEAIYSGEVSEKAKPAKAEKVAKPAKEAKIAIAPKVSKAKKADAEEAPAEKPKKATKKKTEEAGS